MADPGLAHANDEFYAAFEALDLDRMAGLWDHGDDVFCVHPGSDLILGWGPVRRSWAAVFAATEYLQFIVTDVCARPEVGVVTCTENILTDRATDGGLGAGKAVATNVFVYRAGRWHMTAHHASPVVRATGGSPQGGSR